MKKKFSDKPLVFYTDEAFEQYCEDHEERTLVLYDDDIFDVTEFKHKHPGGAGVLEDYHGHDITEIFHSDHSHSHSRTAVKQLNALKVGYMAEIDEDQITSTNHGYEHLDQSSQSYPKIKNSTVQYNDFALDTNVSLVAQIGGLSKKQYSHLVQNPFETTTTRLFNSNLFEKLFKIKWYMGIFLWVPIMLYFVVSSFIQPSGAYQGSSFRFAVYLILGIFIFSLFRYIFHRFMANFELWLPSHSICISLHLCLHGIHYILPRDLDSASIPFAVSSILFTIMYKILEVFFSSWDSGAIFVGFILWYVVHEFFHYKAHSSDEIAGYFADLKAIHKKHHLERLKGFEIIGGLWDILFCSKQE